MCGRNPRVRTSSLTRLDALSETRGREGNQANRKADPSLARMTSDSGLRRIAHSAGLQGGSVPPSRAALRERQGFEPSARDFSHGTDVILSEVAAGRFFGPVLRSARPCSRRISLQDPNEEGLFGPRSGPQNDKGNAAWKAALQKVSSGDFFCRPPFPPFRKAGHPTRAMRAMEKGPNLCRDPQRVGYKALAHAVALAGKGLRSRPRQFNACASRRAASAT